MPPKQKPRASLSSASPSVTASPLSTSLQSPRPSSTAFRLCSQTNKIFHILDEAAHNKWLQQGADLGQGSHLLVEGDVVAAPVAVTRNKELGRWQKLPWAVAARSVFVIEELMRLLDLGLGDLVVVSSSAKERVVFRVWPLSAAGNQLLVLSEAARLLDHHVEVRKLTEPIQLCLSVTLENVSSHELDLEELSGFIQATAEDAVLSVGTRYLAQFYGRDVELKVKEIETTDSNLAMNMHCLALEESTCGADNSLLCTSTPLKTTKSALSNNARCQGEFAAVNSKSKVIVLPAVGKDSSEASAESDFTQAIGGVDSQVAQIEKTLRVALSEHRRNTSWRSPSGVLVWGPPGIGKSLLLKSVARLLRVNGITVTSSDVYTKYLGDAEANLQSKLEEAKRKEPCLIIIDDLDALCPQREGGSGGRSDEARRVAAAVTRLLDDVHASHSRVAVVAAAGANIDPALRRPGRLDLEVELAVPNVQARKAILLALLSGVRHELSPEDVDDVARRTHGFVGSDLRALLAEAMNEKPDASITRHLVETALQQVRPSCMKEVVVDVPNVSWDDIGGLEDLKLALKQAVEWPLKHPEAFERLGISPSKGVLMYGPPGCSKTMIAKALACESGLNFIAIKGPELFSKWVGESERAVRELFRKARQAAPAIVFFDEIDAVGSERGGNGGGKVGDRVLAQLLTEMDGVEQLRNVTVVAATNRPDMMDKALTRPGRLDRLFYVPLPDADTRKKILEVHTRKQKKCLSEDVDFGSLVDRTEGYSGAEVASLCNESAMAALEEMILGQGHFDGETRIQMRHFEKALNIVKPRITKDLLDVYKKFIEDR